MIDIVTTIIQEVRVTNIVMSIQEQVKLQIKDTLNHKTGRIRNTPEMLKLIIHLITANQGVVRSI